MKIQILSTLVLLVGFASQALGTTYYSYPSTYVYPQILGSEATVSAEAIEVRTWGTSPDDSVVCEQLMTTNWFELGPREFVEITLDLTDCTPEQLGGFLFLGNYSKKNSSPQLDASSKIMLEIFDDQGGEMISTDGSTYMQLNPKTENVTLRAVNMNRKKTLRIKLHGQSGF